MTTKTETETNVTEAFAEMPPRYVALQMIKTNAAYNTARAASTDLNNYQKTQNELVKKAQEASTALMTEHKKLSEMIEEWKPTTNV